jgi:hypothetical protein
MFNTITIVPYIAQPTTSPSKWGWDFNHWISWMFHFPLHPHRKNHPMKKSKSTKPPSSLNESNKSANMFRIFCRSPMPITSTVMINTGCHKCFRWEIKFGCTCIKNSLQDPIRSFVYTVMDLKPSPRMWVTMLLRSTFPPSLACT